MSSDSSNPAATGSVAGFDHIALPMQNAEAMVAFYRSLGLAVSENAFLVQVHLGQQMINFHKPEVWQGDFALRAPAAQPPCGDICFVWEGSTDTLTTMLHHAGVDIVEGPVERQGGRRAVGVSHYVRDPDGNLLEFMQYSPAAPHV
jgi:catechol 2,3-dioxygenase-like lactoylglutathione lyase family enzyme